jgi:hypothetical protein
MMEFVAGANTSLDFHSEASLRFRYEYQALTNRSTRNGESLN